MVKKCHSWFFAKYEILITIGVVLVYDFFGFV
jgi:hypothetical protein